MSKNKTNISVSDFVVYQAYDDATPIIGEVVRKGTKMELQSGISTYKSEEDERIFYELRTVTENNYKHNFVFSFTTAEWLTKINK
jgi:hypothetical protein